MMKHFKESLVILMAVLSYLAIAGPANALFIDAKLVGFDSTDANLNGTGPAGGIGRFQLLSNVTGTEVDFLGVEFLAQCLEPDENVSTGNTYRFEVVSLADAPTSVGGMGAVAADWIERIYEGLGHRSMATVALASNIEQSALQMAIYEAGYETAGAFDWGGGTATVTGSGASLVATVAGHLAAPAVTDLDMFGLLNVSLAPTRTVYRAQDFMVFNERTIDVMEPQSLMLFGLGLLGMTGVARKHKK